MQKEKKMKKILFMLLILSLLIGCNDIKDNNSKSGDDSLNEKNEIVSSQVTEVIEDNQNSTNDINDNLDQESPIEVSESLDRLASLMADKSDFLDAYDGELLVFNDFSHDEFLIKNFDTEIINEIGNDQIQENAIRILPEYNDDVLDPNNRLFMNTDLPDDTHIRYADLAMSGIDWGSSSYMCRYELLIMDNNHLLFSFGNNKADKTFELKVSGEIIDTSLSFDDRILVVTKEDAYYIYVFSPYGKLLSKSPINSLAQMEGHIQLIPKNASEYYLMIQTDDDLLIDTYYFDRVTGDHKYVNRQLVLEKVDKLIRSNNMIAVSIRSLNEDGQEIRQILCMDHELKLNYIFETPLDWNLEYLNYPGESHIYMYYSHENNLYKQTHSINDRRLNDIISSDGSWSAYINGYKSSLKFKGGNTGPYRYWSINNILFMYSNNAEIGRVICNDSSITSSINEVIYAGNHHIGINNNGEIVFVISENKSYEDHYSSPLSNSLLGKYVYDSGVIPAYNNGVVFIDGNTYELIYVSEDGEISVKPVIDKDVLSLLNEKSNALYYVMRDFENTFVMSTDKEFFVYDKRSNQSKHEQLANYVRYNDEIGTYIYDQTNYFDFKSLSFKTGYYPFFKRKHDTFIFEDRIYINGFPLVNDDAIQDVEYVEGDFVTLQMYDEEDSLINMNIVDSKSLMRDQGLFDYFIRYEDASLFEYFHESAKQIIPIPVRLFSVSDTDILYSGYDQEAYSYVYSFDTEKVLRLNKTDYTVSQTITDDYYLVGTKNRILIYNRNDLSKIQSSIDLSDHMQNGVDMTYEIHGDNNGDMNFFTLFMPSLEKGVVIDLDDNKSIYEFNAGNVISQDGVIYFTYHKYAMTYNLSSNKLKMVSDEAFNELLTVKNDKIYYQSYYDDYYTYKSHQSDADILSHLQTDYVILYYNDELYQSLHILDRQNNTLDLIAINYFEYEMLEDAVKYRVNKWIDGKSTWSEWEYYDLRQNSTFTFIE